MCVHALNLFLPHTVDEACSLISLIAENSVKDYSDSPKDSEKFLLGNTVECPLFGLNCGIRICW